MGAERNYENLLRLHLGEEELRNKSLAIAEGSSELRLHLAITEAAMDLIDTLRQISSDDEDSKTVTLLSMRVFNAFASSVSLMLAGYYQTSALILRDVLETVFLLNFFSHHPSQIAKWRNASDKSLRTDFGPASIRKALDEVGGNRARKREQMYKMFCDLAGHPSPRGFAMLRPEGMEARAGPFLDPTVLEAVASEMGRLAVQVGIAMAPFAPKGRSEALSARAHMVELSRDWLDTFYGLSSEGERP